MARFVKGDVVVMPFPFSSAAGAKRRPVVVLAVIPYASTADYMVCMITSSSVPDPTMVELEVSDIQGGSLNRKSYVRPAYIFTADEGVIIRKVGTLDGSKLQTVVSTVTSILNR